MPSSWISAITRASRASAVTGQVATSASRPQQTKAVPIREYASFLLVALLVLGQMALLGTYERDQKYLTKLMNQIASPDLLPSQQAIAISQYLRAKPNASHTERSLLSFLRPGPREVAEEGGDCADRSRLMIDLLALRQIHAAKWALHDEQMKPRHAVVEVNSERGRMVIDPLYDLWFPRPEGGFYDIAALHRNPNILRQRIEALKTQPEHRALKAYSMSKFDYSNPRTINWDKSTAMRTVYRLLHSLVGDEANAIARPAWAEQPALMLIYGACIPEALILLALGAGAVWRRGCRPSSLKAESSGIDAKSRRLAA